MAYYVIIIYYTLYQKMKQERTQAALFSTDVPGPATQAALFSSQAGQLRMTVIQHGAWGL